MPRRATLNYWRCSDLPTEKARASGSCLVCLPGSLQRCSLPPACSVPTHHAACASKFVNFQSKIDFDFCDIDGQIFSCRDEAVRVVYSCVR